MKFLHLSDLHIGKQLHHYNLLEEQVEILHQVAAYAKSEKPDAILIAGDIYDTPVPSAEAVAVFDGFLSELDALEDKLTICIIAGNHDSAKRLDYASQILAKHDIHIAGMPPVREEEHLKKVTISDAFGEIDIYLLPFVKPGHVRKMFPDEVLSYSEVVKRLLERETIDNNKRNILVSHQFYAGGGETPVTSESEVHIVGGIDNVEVSLLEMFDYAALGHIHRSQKIGSESNRYCGTLFPYSVSEATDDKAVLLVELGKKGEAVQFTQLPLQLKRKVRSLRGGIEEIMESATEENCHDYVSITLTDEMEASHPRELLEEKYDHILEIRIDNARTRQLLELSDVPLENLNPYDAFSNFFQEMNGRKLSEEEGAMLKQVLQEGGMIEE